MTNHEAWVSVVLLNPKRKVWLPDHKIPSTKLRAGESYEETARALTKAPLENPFGLLGIYSDPFFFTDASIHHFSVVLFAVCDRDGSDWIFEKLLNDLRGADRRILYDAFCFTGTAFMR